MGDRLRKRMGARVTQLYHDFDAALDLFAFFMPNLPLPHYRKRDQAHIEMKKIFGAEIDERRAGAEVCAPSVLGLLDMGLMGVDVAPYRLWTILWTC
jgi:sterol 14-demethylase